MGSLENLDFRLLEGSLVLPAKHLVLVLVVNVHNFFPKRNYILDHLEPHKLSVLKLTPL